MNSPQPGPFENEDALDWARELAADGLDAVTRVFDEVESAGEEFIDARCGAQAVAAAETVARWRLGQATGQRLVDTWLASIGDPPPDELVSAARKALARVARPPSGVWGMFDGHGEWRLAVDTIQSWLTTTDLASQGAIPAGWAGVSPNELQPRSPLHDEHHDLTRRDQALLKALRKAGVDLSRPRLVLQHLYFASEQNALAAAEQAKTAGWDVELCPPDDTMAAWVVVASRDGVVVDADHIRSSTTFFDQLATTHDGLNDGWEVPTENAGP